MKFSDFSQRLNVSYCKPGCGRQLIERREVILMGIKIAQEDYRLTIKPALEPKERHKIEDVLKKLGYQVHGGGTYTDMSECDVSFSK